MTTSNVTPIGIDDIAFATGSYCIDLADIAPRLGAEPAKYHKGLGQERSSVVASDEDPVTMAATAVKKIVDRHGIDGVRTIMFATETGIDQSKAAAVYVHELVGLDPHVRSVELKQACYSGTAALQFACALVARNPEEKVIVVASDIARYDLDSAAEPTQGAGAVAMLVTANPRILAIDAVSGVFTREVMDFWRPNHRSQALVEGKLSIGAYIDAVQGAYEDYRARGGVDFSEIDYFSYHQPFTKMAYKAHRQLSANNGVELTAEDEARQLGPTTEYNRIIGNSYTASAYFGLLSLLDTEKDLAGKKVAVVSYGSGSVAEFLTGNVVEGYESQLRAADNARELDERVKLDDPTYYRHAQVTHEDPGEYSNLGDDALIGTGPFSFTGVEGCKRIYRAR
ncbi:hydroxymethylglutaryl-CoA synthase [Corynebacterium amycolatum]|uniref:hydroxymethylglutaryl-CoA synthase n=1 Tax=Corynebacterium amycolatum TaxID=43765 RepID=UPI003EDE9A71